MLFDLILTEKCNLNCEYCFEKEKGNSSMNIEMIDDIISFIDSYCKNEFVLNKENIRINFNGGEALLKFDLLKKMHEKFIHANINSFSVSTNFILANEEMIDYFFENDFDLHVSCDGKKETHDRYRKDYSGLGSFDSLLQNIKILRRKYPNYQISYSMVFTPETVRNLYENVEFLVGLGIRNITASYCADYDWTEDDYYTYSEQLKKISVLYKDIYNKGEFLYFSLLSRVIESTVMNYGKAECGCCKDQIAILPNGKVIPCTVFLEPSIEDDYIIGSITDGLNHENICSILNPKIINVEDCEECMFKTRCHNNCFAVNKRVSGNAYRILDSACHINQNTIFESDKLIDYFISSKNETFMNQYHDYLI